MTTNTELLEQVHQLYKTVLEMQAQPPVKPEKVYVPIDSKLRFWAYVAYCFSEPISKNGYAVRILGVCSTLDEAKVLLIDEMICVAKGDPINTEFESTPELHHVCKNQHGIWIIEGHVLKVNRGAQ